MLYWFVSSFKNMPKWKKIGENLQSRSDSHIFTKQEAKPGDIQKMQVKIDFTFFFHLFDPKNAETGKTFK